MTGDTTISGAYTLALTGATNLSTHTGYQICDNTILKTSTSNISSIYLGVNAGSNGSGCNNFGVGCNALKNNTSGDLNLAQGQNALYNNTTGNFNIAQGLNALLNNISGNYNIAQGVCALYSNTIGNYNVIQGTNAFNKNTTGSSNVVLGHYTFYSNTAGSNNVALGTCAGYYETGSNKLHIGNHKDCTLICGDFTGKTVTIDNKLITTDFQMTNGATDDYVLTSDASGNATW